MCQLFTLKERKTSYSRSNAFQNAYVGRVGDDADGHGEGVDGHCDAAVDHVVVPEAGSPAALKVNHS